MTDVFISYDREDIERVRPLVTLLESQGWTVWWDRDIQPGENFRDVIKRALDEARCVVVVWSSLSVNSDWVISEASSGSDRGVLVPVLVDPVQLPLGFTSTQAANLTGWKAGEVSEEVQRFFAAVARRLEQDPPDLEVIAAPGRRRRLRRNLLVGLLTAVVALGTIFALRDIELSQLLSDAPGNSVAVGVFDDLTPTHDSQWIGGSIVAELRIGLPRAGILVVGGRQKDRSADSRYVVEGTVRRIGGLIHVSAELISTDNDHQLWSAIYRRTARPDASEQSEIAHEIVAAVSNHILEGGTPTLVRKETPDQPGGALGGLLEIEPAFPALDGQEFPVFEEVNDE